MTETLPRRVYDEQEATDTPVFLLQRRRLVVTDRSGLEWDNDMEAYSDLDGDTLSDEKLIAMEAAHWEWDTQRVAFTREEGDRYAQYRAHDGPFRVYSVPAIGELRTLLHAQTSFDPEPST